MAEILSIKDLTISFRQGKDFFTAVNHVSIDLRQGSSLGIVGESGSGKSLTALSILNLLPPAAIQSSGEIIFQSGRDETVDLGRVDAEQLWRIRGHRIAMIFQEPMTSLNPVYTCGNQVMENILEHTELTRKEATGRIYQLFEDVKLPTPARIFDSYPHELSGGQRQRVMIAMALSCYPDILIADEPTTALDVTVQKSILQLLRELKQKYQMSLIFISHDLGVVAEVADEIAVMYQGQIVERNVTATLLKNPERNYTKGLLACRPSLSKKEERLITLKEVTTGTSQNNERKEKKKPAETEEKTLFQVDNVSKYYSLKRNFWGRTVRFHQALKEINLQIKTGETLGLVGESGSGKSTLGRVILALLDYEEGAVSFRSKSVASMKKSGMKDFRKKAQIIFQDPYSSLNPRISVGEMIGEPLKYYRLYPDKMERKSRVIELLKDVRLDESFFYRYPHELSGGQRQRVAIARVLALNPEFIVCDEAVSALDVSVQAEILNLLQDLKERYNLTYVFISHDFSVIRFMADRIAVMKEGQIVELNDADLLLDNPQSPYTQKLLASVPGL